MKTKKHTSRINNSNNNTNNIIIHILTLVKDYYKEQNDKFRIKTYERAIYQIRKWDKPITKGSDLSHLEGIGKGMIEKIDTIISSGTLPIIKEKNIKDKKVYNYTKDSKYTKTKKNHNHNNTNNEVTSILGFNKIFINDIKKKYSARTIHDIRKVFSDSDSGLALNLTHIQHLGLNYYEDLQDLIPRDEITYLGNQFKKKIENSDKKYTMLLSGSYPSHSKEYSKDIDIIIVRNVEDSYSGELKDIIDIIEKIGNDTKTHVKLETISLGEKKFMGLLHSPKSNKMRHIDIRFVNVEELPYTWLYYSSGQIFNKLIRDKLKKKGYKLNEYGLYEGKSKVNIDKNIEYDLEIKKKYNDKNTLSYIENVEKQIFKYADMEYKSVKERY
jgi:DNA polymerase/3'-5' exonuclease PolX